METVLSGDLNGDDAPVTDPADLASDPTRTDNSETVVVGEGVDRFTIIDGFLITAGFNTDLNFTIGGGGMRITESSPTIRNCTFAFNAAVRTGAGIDSRNSEPTLINCRFRGNGGPALKNAWDSAYILNTVFSGNSNPGGAVMLNFFSDVRLVNCTIAGNHSRTILSGNDSKLALTNCIVWANPGRLFDEQPNTEVNYSCLEGGWSGAGGAGNIDVDPLFVRTPGQGTDPEVLPDFGELRLRCDSPCVDAGDTASLPVEVTTDLDGAPRVRGSAVNMGAYEGLRQALAIDTTPLSIPENDAISLSIALACDPGEPIEVETVRVSGDPDIDVVSGHILRFDGTNFATPQAITLAAAGDLDLFAGVATVRASMPDVPSVFLTVTENDDDVSPILFVDVASDGFDNGTSWADAFHDLQGALLVARQVPEIVDEIWVAAGTYRPAPPHGDRAATFLRVEGLRLYGGFSGTETVRDQRNAAANTTILSGDLNGDDGPGFTNTGENSRHVVSAKLLQVAPLVDGFAIQGGNATDQDPELCPPRGGGGLRSECSFLRVRNCRFNENQGRGDGWGVGGNDDFGDLRLRPGSPAIDAGANEVNLGERDGIATAIGPDLGGLPRFLDDPDTLDSGVGAPPIVDIGAYEFALDGDSDFDFDIDLADFLAILACQHGRSVSVANDCRHADLDGDGDVDLADLIAFQARFTGSR